MLHEILFDQFFSDFLFNTKAFVLQAHDEHDKENEGRTGKVKYWIN